MTVQNGVYEVTEIYEKTYLINEKMSTMFVLLGETRALVIDCGTGIGDFKSVVESLTKSLPYDIVITHSHVDHVGGRGQFDDIFLTETDSKYIKSVTMAYRKFYAITNRIVAGPVKNKKFTPVKKEPAVHYVGEGDVFDLGGRTVRVYLTPGHTVGSISLLDETNRTIFIGDVANEMLLMCLPHATTIDTMIQTLNRIISIDGYDAVWSSHHIAPSSREDIREFLNGAETLAKKKNTLLPFVRSYKYDGNTLVYRTNNIH